MKKIQTVQKIKGKRVLVRVDFNVPIANGKVRDVFRIEQSLKTITYLHKKGAIQILIAHLGNDGAVTLKPILKVLEKKVKVQFLTEEIDSEKLHKKITQAKPGTIFLLENIRRYKGEEENDTAFAKQLAVLGEVYVNDAFSVSHRPHASIVGVPKLLPAYAGFQLQEEVAALEPIVKKPVKPFIFILGGAKFSTKIPLIERYAKQADKVIIAGAIMNNFYKAAGFEVGNSVIEAGYDTEIKKYLSFLNVLLPVDVVVQRGKNTITVAPTEVEPGDVIVDIGEQSVNLLKPLIEEAKLIVWNGPMGWYEKGFTAGTVALGKLLATTKSQVVIGGGDTITVLGDAFAKKKHIFISTGGGATIDYLSQGSLPGVDEL